MSQAVLQMIRDFVLAPALLGSSLVSVLGAVTLLGVLGPQGLRAGRAMYWTAASILAAFVVTSVVLVVAGTMVAHFEISWANRLGYGVCALVWGSVVLCRSELEWRVRWRPATAGAAVMGLAVWMVDAYVVPALLFVE